MAPKSWWKQIEGADLQQGEVLQPCWIPVLPATYWQSDQSGSMEFDVLEHHLIVLTHSCDLGKPSRAKDRPFMVATAAIWTVQEYERDHPAWKQKGA